MYVHDAHLRFTPNGGILAVLSPCYPASFVIVFIIQFKGYGVTGLAPASGSRGGSVSRYPSNSSANAYSIVSGLIPIISMLLCCKRFYAYSSSNMNVFLRPARFVLFLRLCSSCPLARKPRLLLRKLLLNFYFKNISIEHIFPHAATVNKTFTLLSSRHSVYPCCTSFILHLPRFKLSLSCSG